MIRIFHIGDRSEYALIGQLLGQVHYQEYELTNCTPIDDLLTEILSKKYDVILLDYHWGDERFAKNLLVGARTQGCTIPILVMTDEMEADVDRKVIQEGASDYLVKGRIETQLIERTIRYAIERKAAEIRLAQLAHYDPLTKIPNRLLFRDRLEHALQIATRDEKPLTLMYMDLNGFKKINDSLGHEAGDKLLRSCADRIAECMRRSDSVARIGGDEFTVLLEHSETTTDTARIAEKIIQAIEEPHYIDNQAIFVGCSIGIAVFPRAGRDADTLQRNADMAMYQAKQSSRSEYRFFTEAMNIESRRQLLLHADLQNALEHEEFTLFYQPRINVLEKKVEGINTVIRWYHPTKGWLQSDRFKALSEHTGLIVPLQQWAFAQLCEDLMRFGDGVPALPCLSLPLSTKHLDNPRVLELLKERNKVLPASKYPLEFLITEAALVEQPAEALAFIKEIRTLGYGIALNEFGAERTSLKLLSSVRFQRIELAHSLVVICETPDAQKTIKLAVLIANQLNVPLTASHVDRKNQMISLQQLGCKIMSGDAISPDTNFQRALNQSISVAEKIS